MIYDMILGQKFEVFLKSSPWKWNHWYIDWQVIEIFSQCKPISIVINSKETKLVGWSMIWNSRTNIYSKECLRWRKLRWHWNTIWLLLKCLKKSGPLYQAIELKISSRSSNFSPKESFEKNLKTVDKYCLSGGSDPELILWSSVRGSLSDHFLNDHSMDLIRYKSDGDKETSGSGHSPWSIPADRVLTLRSPWYFLLAGGLLSGKMAKRL